MRKWRPSFCCTYIIPEIHGNATLLEIILNRILPFRSHIGQKDILIFLGDYIDKGEQSADVLNILLNIQQEYPDRIFFLRGNHEELLLRAMHSEQDYDKWLDQGGQSTISSYTKNNYRIPFNRLTDVIPSPHLQFLRETRISFQLDNYLFFHGGINLADPNQTTDDTFIFDHSSSKSFKEKPNLINTQMSFIGAHNFKSKRPYFDPKYLMLGGSLAPSRLTIFELNSFQCSMIKNNKSRIYKTKIV